MEAAEMVLTITASEGRLLIIGIMCVMCGIGMVLLALIAKENPIIKKQAKLVIMSYVFFMIVIIGLVYLDMMVVPEHKKVEKVTTTKGK